MGKWKNRGLREENRKRERGRERGRKEGGEGKNREDEQKEGGLRGFWGWGIVLHVDKYNIFYHMSANYKYQLLMCMRWLGGGSWGDMWVGVYI